MLSHPGRQAARFGLLDANGDGALTQEEATAQGKKVQDREREVPTSAQYPAAPASALDTPAALNTQPHQHQRSTHQQRSIPSRASSSTQRTVLLGRDKGVFGGRAEGAPTRAERGKQEKSFPRGAPMQHLPR